MISNLSKSIVFITGAFMSSSCWDGWINYFKNIGYSCIAPCWPYKDATPEELRNRHPDPEIASNRLSDIIDYYELIVNTLNEKPILIGHSFGGLIVQLMLQRGLGSAGIALHSFPPQGVGIFRFSFFKAWWNAIGFLTTERETYMVSFEKWKNAISNGLKGDEQKQSYYNYAIPESKLIIRDAFKSTGKINFTKSHSPLLFTSGGEDKMITPALIYDNYKKYTDENSITDYAEFKNCNHLVFCAPVSTELAEFILKWLAKIG